MFRLMSIPPFDSTLNTPLAIPRETERRPTHLEQEVMALFDEYRDRLLRYVLSIGVCVDDGEEIVQEVFLSLFRHLSLRRSRANLRGWLFRVAHNLALKQRSRDRRTDSGAEQIEDRHDPTPGPEEQLAARQRQGRLLAVFLALPETDRYCLSLRAEGLRYREIAAVLGISLGSVSISLTRSIARLSRADRG